MPTRTPPKRPAKKAKIANTTKPASPTRKVIVKRTENISGLRDWQGLGPALDALVEQYKVPAYVNNDPIQLPYRYLDSPRDCELVAFVTALFSYGRRDIIIQTMRGIFQIVGPEPLAFLEAFDPKRDAKLFEHFIYRFNKGSDLVYLLARLQWAYREFESLENLFEEGLAHAKAFTPSSDKNKESEANASLKLGIAGFIDLLLEKQAPKSYGLKFLFAHPERGGACKRFNMFLRWMVRQDLEPSGKVDFGLWKRVLSPADLLIPLDTHVMKMNTKLGLSPRQDGSWQTAEEITQVFRGLCPNDPVKYDYALFGFSLDKRNMEELLTLAAIKSH